MFLERVRSLFHETVLMGFKAEMSEWLQQPLNSRVCPGDQINNSNFNSAASRPQWAEHNDKQRAAQHAVQVTRSTRYRTVGLGDVQVWAALWGGRGDEWVGRGGSLRELQMMDLSSVSVSWLTAMILLSSSAYLAWSCMKCGMRTFSIWATSFSLSTSSYDTWGDGPTQETEKSERSRQGVNVVSLQHGVFVLVLNQNSASLQLWQNAYCDDNPASRCFTSY